MSYRKTYGQVKNLIGQPIGMCGTDPGLLPRVNEASSLLWNEGDFVGKFSRYRFRIGMVNGCPQITWPTEIETIEAIESCGGSIRIRNVYFEFIENTHTYSGRAGYGYGGNGFGRYGFLGDRDEVCTMQDITCGGGKHVKAYSSLPADNGAQIIIFGYDDNLNWIRTQQNGTYVDGEYLTLNATTAPTTVNFFSGISGIQFSVTPRNGDVTITQVDTLNGNVETTLSTYGYNEAVPIYRRSILTGYGQAVPDPDETTPCYPALTALCRMRFVPIIFDTDYLQIGNISALTEMLISLQKRDNGKIQDAEMFRQRAIRALDQELRQFQGVAPKKVVSFQNRSLWGCAPNLR